MTDSGTIPVLGVHGVWNHQGGLEPQAAAERIADWWRDAIAAGIGRPAEDSPFQVTMAYYAHHLRTRTAQGPDDLEALDTATQADIVEWARLLGAEEPVVQGWLTAPARAAVSWVATRFGLNHALARGLARAFFSELGAYFTDHDRRAAARTQVTNALHHTRPRVLIAHSLGSAVAYEALWAAPHPPIELLITLGSPLAMPHLVFDRLAPHPGPRRKPPGVNRWINITDPGDIIAIPPGGVRTRFAEVTSDLANAIGAFDFHRSTTYLKNAVTAAALTPYL
ncbi:hypothetical protein ABZ914_02925 [Spirillospora sp. NPDC046719]